MDIRLKTFEEYEAAYEQAKNNPSEYWGKIAENFQFSKKWQDVTLGDFTDGEIRWFNGAKLNITENCLDRHLETRGDKKALVYVANDPSEKNQEFTYKELHAQVCKTANMLEELGVKKGDRVCIYMSMVPELMFTVLACARIGAIHSVVFGGFSAQALAGRIVDAECSVLVTNDGGLRGTKVTELKSIVDEALKEKDCSCVKNVIVHKRANNKVTMQDGRDLWWHELFDKASDKHTAPQLDAEDPLFILYTSGSTGTPKGVVHTQAGYMVWAAYTFANVFQVDPGESSKDMYWCTADIGWITGHTYITYGPLLNGATTMMFEGVPTYPDAGRFWDIVEKNKVTHFYTAPTAVRALMACGDDVPAKYDLSTLKVLGSVGEPINAEAWHWYNEHIGKKKCPIVDTWWQTETGGILISPLAGLTKTKPCKATLPLPGIIPVLVDDDGREIGETMAEGKLCIKHPWPGMLRTVYKNHERFMNAYLRTYKGYYFSGDGAKRDIEGYMRITGRVDDVINVSGHRFGTAEIENAIGKNTAIAESAVVGYPHDVKGEGIYAYVVTDLKDEAEVTKHINDTIIKEIGAVARPDKIQIVSGLPKTRSGKIMRRILRKIAAHDFNNFGDTSTLLDPSVVEEIKEGVK
ncbi:acetate--CoA ligase [Halobacteriovorax vibrionivorans]|uniref:Acetate--CoA ligase n=1 Tax=Halobacteriovorax vibrionivorans TaxID=2152716 RepID=A0ABY0IJE6_9BACT|nr:MULTISPECIES: acetate--CoA ligase [Halobacteriovorax]RZF21457.1 acetate--CoA ligase [Halobacteriovorax vibrionivorans]TGD48730.1 acetate--CoA ligase [Halobacteriovorax sp. Y22]